MPAKMSKKSKRPDKRPSRIRYWLAGRLEAHKVKNILRYGWMVKTQHGERRINKAEATAYWREHRKGRMKREKLSLI